MLAKVEIVHKFCFFKFRILFQGKERLQRQKFMPAKLRAVLVTFGFAKI